MSRRETLSAIIATISLGKSVNRAIIESRMRYSEEIRVSLRV